MGKLVKIGCGGALLMVVILAVIGGGSASDTPASTAAAWEQPRADSMEIPGVRVPVTPERVSLDFATRRMTIVARVPRSLLAADGSGFVWAFFTNPEFIDGSWSDMPLRATVTGTGDTVTLTARGERFGWSDNANVPRAGYKAYVVVGPDSVKLYLASRYRDKAKAVVDVQPR